MKSTSVKTLHLLFKITLMLVSLFIIYNQVVVKENFQDFINDTRILSQKKSIYLLVAAVFLMTANWFVEAIKWKYLIMRIYPISYYTAWAAVLSGVMVSFFTPNRMGEFAGRVMHLPEGTRLKATLATFIGNTAQLLSTLIFGLISFCFYVPVFFELSSIQFTIFIVATFIISVTLLIFYFRIAMLDKLIQKIKWFQRFSKQTHAFKEYTTNQLLYVLCLSVFRYFIFSSQYILMLFLFENNISIIPMYAAVAIVFLIITIVPTIALSELAIRSSVAVSVISLFGGSSIHILEASFLLWIVNLVMPAIAGSVSLLTLKFSKQD